MVLEQKPNDTKALEFPPVQGEPYKVHSGENWTSIAARFGLSAWNLIEFNFPAVKEVATFDVKCRQVNWLLRTHVGCTKSLDGKNYSFDSTDSPGLVYVPSRKDDNPTTLAALQIFGTPVPSGLPPWSGWSASSYCDALKKQCERLYTTGVGGAVIRALRRKIAIRPLKHSRDFLPVYVPSEGTVYYMPGVFMPTSRSFVPASQLMVGASADASLLHELVHAMRDTNRRWAADQEEMPAIKYPPWSTGNRPIDHLFFGKRGEFNAIVVTNIYLSEINPGRLDPLHRGRVLLVKDHHLGHANMGLVAPEYFHKSSAIRHYLKLLWDDQEQFCTEIAQVNSEFNPIRDYKKES